MFEYEINNGEVLIISFTDKSGPHIIIPEFIGSYPITGIQLVLSPHVIAINIPKSVKYIYESCFIYTSNLTYINNIKLNDGFNLINDGFIYLAPKTIRLVYKIRFKICDDYVCVFRDTTFIYINDCMCY